LGFGGFVFFPETPKGTACRPKTGDARKLPLRQRQRGGAPLIAGGLEFRGRVLPGTGRNLLPHKRAAGSLMFPFFGFCIGGGRGIGKGGGGGGGGQGPGAWAEGNRPESSWWRGVAPPGADRNIPAGKTPIFASGTQKPGARTRTGGGPWGTLLCPGRAWSGGAPGPFPWLVFSRRAGVPPCGGGGRGRMGAFVPARQGGLWNAWGEFFPPGPGGPHRGTSVRPGAAKNRNGSGAGVFRGPGLPGGAASSGLFRGGPGGARGGGGLRRGAGTANG